MPWDLPDKLRDEDGERRLGTRRSRWRGKGERRERGTLGRRGANAETIHGEPLFIDHPMLVPLPDTPATRALEAVGRQLARFVLASALPPNTLRGTVPWEKFCSIRRRWTKLLQNCGERPN